MYEEGIKELWFLGRPWFSGVWGTTGSETVGVVCDDAEAVARARPCLKSFHVAPTRKERLACPATFLRRKVKALLTPVIPPTKPGSRYVCIR